MLTIRLHHLFGAALLQPPHGRKPPVRRQQLGVRAAFDGVTASDYTFAFPALLSAIMQTAVCGPGLVMSIVAIGIFDFTTVIRAETALGYLGLGTHPPQPSWGRMPQRGAVADVEGGLSRRVPRRGHRAKRAGA